MSEKYLDAAIKNVEDNLEKHELKLPTICDTPLSSNYRPSKDTTTELNASGVQDLQGLIGGLIWPVELVRVDILLEVSLLSTRLTFTYEGHLQQVYYIFGYLKKSPRQRVFMNPDHPHIDRFKKFDRVDFYIDVEESIPSDMPEPRGNVMSTHFFVDANNAANKVTRRSQTGILLFYNKAPFI